MRQFLMVAFVTLLLAGESYCLIMTKSKQDYQQAKDISVELQENILELSASLRNGEAEKFEQARANYDAKLETFAKYAAGSNVYRELEVYKDWLENSETEKLLQFNARLSDYNRGKANGIEGQVELIRVLQAAEYSKTTSEDIAKLLGIAERAQQCVSYCFAEDYRSLEAEYQEASTKMTEDWEKINSEYAARLRSEALIESLENF